MTPPARRNPYVGLRPFFATDAHVFFGRDEQITELQEILHRARFLPVVGGSGSGKSSLVRAGLIPRLSAGFLVADADKWVVITCKPGDAPINNFATELAKAFGVSDAVDGEDGLEASIRLALSSGASDFIEQHRDPRASVMILVDQFEELFAFRGSVVDDDVLPTEVRAHYARRRAEAADFVDMLLGLAESVAPIYVVLTMRSDFLGDCDLFHGLPEAMNKARYLVPRLSRDQLRQAVEGPAMMAGARMSARLVDGLVNALGDRADRLPMLQHAVQRTFDYWADHGATGPIDLEHFKGAGELEGALNQDAETALALVDAKVTERVFRALTDTDISQRRVRHPCRIEALARAAGVERQEVDAIIDAFRADDRHFLYRARDGEPDNPRIDISHESLIRQWPRLTAWVDVERKARDAYLWLVAAARSAMAGERDLMTGIEYTNQREKWDALGATRAWAERYAKASDDFDVVEGFMNESAQAVEDEKAERLQADLDAAQAVADRQRARRNLFVGLAAVGVATLLIVGNSYRESRASLRLAERANRINAIRDFSINDPTIAAALVAEMSDTAGLQLQWSEVSALRRIASAQVARFIEDSVVDAQVSRTAGSSRVLMLKGDGSLRLWSSLDSAPRAIPPVSSSGDFLAANRSLTRAVVSDSMGVLQVIDLATGRHRTLGRDSATRAARRDSASRSTPPRISDDGNVILASCGGTTLCRYTLDADFVTSKDTARRDLMSVSCPISGQDLSQDGRRIVVACWSGQAWLWTPDAPDKQREVPLARHVADGLGNIRFSLDGTRIVAGCLQGHVQLWSVAKPGEQRLVSLGTEVSQVRFRDDGGAVVVGTEEGAALFDANSAKPEVRWYREHRGAVTNVRFSVDGHTIITSSLDGTARVWPESLAVSAQQRERMRGRRDSTRGVFKGHSAAVTWANLAGDGSSLVTVSDDGTARVWSTAQEPEPLVVRLPGRGIWRAHLSDNDTSLAIVTVDGALRMLTVGVNARTGDVEQREGDAPVISGRDELGFVRDARYVRGVLHAVTTLSDSTLLFRINGAVPERVGAFPTDKVGLRSLDRSGRYVGYLDGHNTASAWDAVTQRRVTRQGVEGETEFDDVTSMIASDGSIGITSRVAYYDGTALVWSLKDGRPLQRLRKADGFAWEIRPDGRMIASSLRDNQIGLYPVTGHDAGAERMLQGAQNRIVSLAFDVTGTMLAAGDTAGTVNIWAWGARGRGGRSGMLRLTGHREAITSIEFSADNDHIVTGSSDGTVRVWTIAPFELVDRIRRYTQVCVPASVRVDRLKESVARAEAQYRLCVNRPRLAAALRDR